MLTFGREEQKLFDRLAEERLGIPELLLMEAAGRALARTATEVAERRPELAQIPIAIFVGGGNNGGDGLVAARILAAGRYSVRVYYADERLFSERYSMPPSAQANARIAQALGLSLRPIADYVPGPGLIIDALLGTGFDSRRPLSSVCHSAIEAINRARAEYGAYVIACDLPSGLNADGGAVGQLYVRADLTVTFVRPKTGIIDAPGFAASGEIQVCDLDIPSVVTEKLLRENEDFDAAPTLVDREYIYSRRHVPAADTHKGAQGRLGLIAGAPEMPGAACLAARGAQHAGAGYVHMLVPAAIVPACLKAVPSALFYAWNTVDELRQRAMELAQQVDVIALGPGWGDNPEYAVVIYDLLETDLPLLIDADGLNIISKNVATAIKFAGAAKRRLLDDLPPVILTPHPGEAARLFRVFAPGVSVPPDRIRFARRLAEASGAITVLKGARTVTAVPLKDRVKLYINSSGNPGLARAGSGDVLTGLIGGLLAQGVDPTTASLAGVYFHGRAADELVENSGTHGVTPELLIARLGQSFLQGGWE